MSKISITRALVELKTLDSRINKLISGTQFIVCKTKKSNYSVQESEFDKSTRSTYQSLTDLIKQRDRIKARIVQSNATTVVRIGTDQLTVADAIERKKTIQYQKSLVECLRLQRNTTTREAEAHKDRVQAKIDENIRNIFSKEFKTDASSIKPITDSIQAADPCEVFDPLKISQLIESLEDEITGFESNVDFALSESNALTQIEC
jgi:hypothetical protein